MEMNVMPVGTMAGFKADSFQRSFDPENYRLHVRGVACDVRKVSDEMRRVESAGAVMACSVART